MGVFNHIIYVIFDYLNKIVEAHVRSALNDHIRPLRKSMQKQQDTMTDQNDGGAWWLTAL